MLSPTVLFEKHDQIAIVTLNRPEALNAINSQMASELLDVAGRIDDDNEVRAVVLAGAGERAFSTGMDLNELADATEGVNEPQVLLDIRRRLWDANPWERWARLSKPTIAAIRGSALGGGLELALVCDLRLTSEDATFGFPEVRLGIIPGRGGTQRLPRLVGRAQALEMILTGDTINAAEAHRIELVSCVVPSASLQAEAIGLAARLAAYAPLPIRMARDAVKQGMDMTFDQGLHLETDLYVLLQTTEDRAEGIRSFKEKRKPKFSGR